MCVLLTQRRYWDGSGWQPAGKYHEKLEGDFTAPLAAASWGPERLDVVGLTPIGNYSHLYYDGDNWQGWEDFGGNFSR